MSSSILPIVMSKCGRLPDRTFSSYGDFQQFLSNERELWKWMAYGESAAALPGSHRAIPSNLWATLNRCQDTLQSAITDAGQGKEESAKKRIKDILGELSHAYVPDIAFHSEEPSGKLIASMRPHGYSAMAGAYACLSGVTLERNQVYGAEAVLGWSEAAHHRLGLGNAAEHSRQQFEQLMSRAESERRDFADRTKADRDAVAELVSSTTKANQSAATETSSMKEKLEKFLMEKSASVESIRQKNHEKCESAAQEFHEKLKAIGDMYSQKLALSAPVEYWKKRQKACWRWAWVGIGVCVFAAVAFVWLLIYQIDSAITSDSGLAATGQPVSAWTPTHAWNFAKVLVITTAGLWAMKLLVRFTLSQVHLALDAGFRVVLTNSFLALIGEKHIEDKDARELVLKALFRPASTGMIRDDAMPPTPTAEIVQRITGDK